MGRSKYLKHVTIVAQRNNNYSVKGNCSSAKGNNNSGKGSKTTIMQRETIISFNTMHEKKQTTKRDKHKKTHNTKLLLLKKM
jgi:hypothetical protein